MTAGPCEAAVAAHPRSLLGAGAAAWGLVLTGLLLTLSEPAGAAVADLDEVVRRSMVEHEWTWLVRLTEALAVAGGVWVTAPLRMVVGLWLAARRWWWRLGAWVGSIAVSEVVVTQLKQGYGRERPPLALEVTRSDAFPSGHAAATAVTIATLLLLLLPPGPSRRRWVWPGAVVVVLMAASRVYLRVHWLSDVAMGAAIGLAAALSAVGLAAAGQRLRARRGSSPRHPGR